MKSEGADLRYSSPTPIRRDGALDVCTTSRLAGWAVLDGEPAEVEIVINSEPIASIRCREPRRDLAVKGLPKNSGFIFLFPHPLQPSDDVSVRFLDGTSLHNSPRTPVRYESSLDLCTPTRVEGWALCDGQPAEVDIFVNNERRARLHCDRPRPDLAQIGIPIHTGYAFAFRRPLIADDEVAVRFPDGTHVSGSPARALP